MASDRKGKRQNLHLPMTNCNDSQSYLLHPEMSPRTPPQFSMSPGFAYTEEARNTLQGTRYLASSPGTWHFSRNNSLTPLISNSPPNSIASWHDSRNNSLTPLIPESPCGGGVLKMDGGVQFNRICGNKMYGVGDLEHIHIDGMNSPSSPKMYDYADYGHQYEELPGGRKSVIAKCNMDSGTDSRSEYQSSGGATDITETGDTANIINEKRKRVNPLYDQMTQSMPSIYNKTKGSKDEGLRKQVQYLKCALLVLVVISLAAMAVSVFAMINSHSEDHDHDLAPMIQRLKQDYDRMEDLMSSFQDNDTMRILSQLLSRVDHLETNVTSGISYLFNKAAKADSDIEQNAQELAASKSNLSEVISFLNLTIQLQLHNISKQQGPRGAQGVANFSMCSYYNVSNNAAASDNFPSYSPWAPTETDLETKVALFGACTMEGGTVSVLETHAITRSHVQYRCKCSGTVPDKSRRICYIHIFACPRLS